MGAPIRSSTEITQIITRSQHALADLGSQVADELKQGQDNSMISHRDKVYRMILIRIYLQTILTSTGNIIAYYSAAVNEKKFNQILDGLVGLTGIFGGPSIPMLGRINLPLYFFPSSSGPNPNPPISSGVPGGRFSATANSPNTVVDSFSGFQSAFAMWIVNVAGINSGEGSRTSFVVASLRGSSTPDWNEIKTPDVGGITTPITFSVVLSGGNLELLATTSTNGWLVTGVRILYQN